jgi:hypothetical protein
VRHQKALHCTLARASALNNSLFVSLKVARIMSHNTIFRQTVVRACLVNNVPTHHTALAKLLYILFDWSMTQRIQNAVGAD